MPNPARVKAALERAAEDGRAPSLGKPDGRRRTRHLAIGDAQAPLETFLTILERHRLLGTDGRLSADVHLVSIGDHFDYGPPAWREAATREGLELLAWLAAHPADQTTLILGNHDLARVDGLSHFDAESYQAARAEADRAYQLGHPDEALEAAFAAKWPQVPDSESLARDYSTFSVAQRELVTRLLRERRAVLAYAHSERLLLVHAGVTRADLRGIAVPDTTATATAAGLDGFLAAAVARWPEGAPLDLRPLYRPGSAAGGSARGALSHRPANPAITDWADLEGPPRRRFDPRDLPEGFTQAIGHIRDGKCRALLGDWVAPFTAEADGVLRSMTVEGQAVRYGPGVHPHARLVFIDGGMNHAPVERYELFDLDQLNAVRAPI